MAGDLSAGLDMLAASAQPVKPGARLTWGVVASAGGPPVQVVLENDATATARPVSANAAGPVAVGDRVLLARQRRRLTIVANPSAQARLLTDTGRVAVPLSAGFTGQAWVRRVGVMVELWASVTGTIPEGNTGLAICPEGFRPTGEDARFGAYFGGAYQGVGYVTPGGAVGVTQRTGGTRTDVRGRGNWLLN